MAIRVALHHITRYTYDRTVELGPHVIRLRPAPHTRTPIQAYSLRVTPAKHFLNWQQDPFGNWQARLVFPEKGTRELTVEVDLVAELVAFNPFDFFVEEYAENYPFAYEPALKHELMPYLDVSAGGERLAKLSARVRKDIARDARRNIDVLVEVNQCVQELLRYDIRMEPGVFPPEETLERGHGSCRDFAWLMVNLLRSLGYAARFVSGYSIQLKPDQKPVTGPAGVSEDCTDLHAWAEVYLPGAGWIGLDATSGLFSGEGHIPLAATAEPSSAAPITGAYGWDKEKEDDELHEEFTVEMKVTRIEDRPRSTKPYNEAQWQAIVACGEQVENSLKDHDVRLTMGGEPTFVAMEDPEGEEWNTAALGPTKQGFADTLVRRLKQRFAPGGLLHHGQGKWYPDEPLPRWAYSCYFRRDGQPIWNDPALIAEDNSKLGHDVPQAEKFVTALADRLAVDSRCVQTGYEDMLYYLWRERRLPVNVNVQDSKLENEQERARMRRIFERGLPTPVGFALPLRATFEGGHVHWQTGRWFMRDERMCLLPGDSPMGYRLPLESLPWANAGDVHYHWERDPMAPREALPSRQALLQSQRGGKPAEPVKVPAPFESARDPVRTAICVEARNGLLHVFMPPLEELESYLALVGAVEETAKALHLPVQLEGYHPPKDHRMDRIQVTPDPGVIEVNVQPAQSWKHLVDITTAVYEEARACGLASEKFMLDGRHTGTGGGNHITLGGPSPADSPILRRPDLLASLSRYWINHPSLSYLFSGLFVGPTSQAPRVDEARHDSVYELEIAYGALAHHKGEAPPWLVDRIFRNLLTDVTGNTHRTELSIDKLYSPDGPTGRQGLLELRAFEMPPDAKMSCAAQLLVRALVASFWKKPYQRDPVRWGTTLMDRFMLPEFVRQDFEDVVRDLQVTGFDVDPSWFTPHYEYRFPILGRTAVAGLEIELRQAIEPWHVMGEEAARGGNVRYVDSSVERVQVVVRNLTDPRHFLSCNGRRVPLHPTGTVGEHVAAVRFRAWQPPSALHPTIGVHSPLVFDLLDSWSERSLGGCSYHVSHPGGRSFEDFPSNALAAESRRASRFFAFGHTPGRRLMPAAERNRDLPLTLDLRHTPTQGI